MKALLKIIVIILFSLKPFSSLAAGKIYGKSKTVDKEYTKYELCRLKKVEVNMKDGEKMDLNVFLKDNLKGKM